jgi:hypothetical protein
MLFFDDLKRRKVLEMEWTMKILTSLLLALLAIFGVLLAVKYTNSGTETADVKFIYQRATEYEDGTPLSLEEIKYTELYCDGGLVAREAGADGQILAALTGGSHYCYATHVDINDVKSIPGNTITRIVEL